MLARPASDEYAPYYDAYVSTVPDGDIRDLLRLQLNDTIALLANVDDARAAKGYGPGKWTLKESILHLIDAERVFAYRLLRVARGDQTPLPGFEQDEWVPQSGANGRSVASLLLELSTVRASTVLLIGSMPAALRRSFSSAEVMALTSSPCRRRMISCGIFAGPASPDQVS